MFLCNAVDIFMNAVFGNYFPSLKEPPNQPPHGADNISPNAPDCTDRPLEQPWVGSRHRNSSPNSSHPYNRCADGRFVGHLGSR